MFSRVRQAIKVSRKGASVETKKKNNECHHIAEDHWIKYILRRTDGEYFPLTGYRCRKCGEEFVSDGIWWAIQGIPPNVIFEPEPEGDEIIIDLGFGKVRANKNV